MRKLTLTLPFILVVVVALGLLAGPAAAAPAGTFPKIIPLPNGFQPEGIAVGRGTEFFVGSLGRLGEDGVTLTGGAIYRGDLRTGQGAILVPAQEGRTAVGLTVDRRTNYLFVAGGPFGTGYVYDAKTGVLVADYQLTTTPFLQTLVNDVVVTRDAAYFTDSFRPFLYRVPLGPGGTLPDQSAVEEIPLGGDFVFLPGAFNANGIAATPNGKWLVLVHSNLGALYRVDPATGEATQIDLGAAAVPSGDGLLLDGRTLYVVQNFFNQIAVVQLDPQLSTGTVERIITDPNFRVPTTIGEFGAALYAVNARFDVAPPPFPGNPPADPSLEFEVVRVPKR